MNGRADAEAIFREGVRAVQPEQLIRAAVTMSEDLLTVCGDEFSLKAFDHIYVTGAGKAAAAMALTLEELLGDRITAGVIAVKYGHELPLTKIRQLSAAHPVPDDQGVLAAVEIGALADEAGEEDLIICLFSGGASALLADCPDEITLDDLQEVSSLLLRSGADIAEINTVRKHLSTLKGGQLARRASPARVTALIISDVVGDDPGVIASGPVSPDASTFSDAWQVIERYRLARQVPSAIRRRLENGRLGLAPETPKPADPLFAGIRTHIIGNNRMALGAAADKANQLGYATRILGTGATGRVEEIAASLIKEATDYRGERPVCLLLGGESTVEVRGEGLGGRNQHLALTAAAILKDHPEITLLSAGTDGTDGPTDMAGAVVDAVTWDRSVKLGLRPGEFLKACDSYHFFEQVGGHIRTGPTQTNVMDLMIALIHKP